MSRVGYIQVGQFEPRVDENGVHCLNCDAVLVGRRKRYCSDKCTHEFYTTKNWGMLRDKLLVESNCTCVKCGFHVEKTSVKFSGGFYFWACVAPKNDERLGKRYYWPSRLFVVDHIVPIFEGGEEFDKANLQVLCKECNKKKTKSDMKKYWRQQKIGMLGPWWTGFWDRINHQKQLDGWMKICDTKLHVAHYRGKTQ